MKVITTDGTEIELGAVEETPTVGIIDYSRRVTDDFGVTTIVERGFARRLSVRLAVPFDSATDLQLRLAELRATAARWVADERFAWLNFEGFYKDFEIDLNVPPLSFCTLTVEGLAETEVVPDGGQDPSPGAPSTWRLVQPVQPLTAISNVAENDYPEWAGATTYALGARVIKAATHRVYESAIAGNVGEDPALGAGKWIDIGPTNRWAMLDQALGTATVAPGAISATLTTMAINAVALLDVDAATVRVEAFAYDRTLPVEGGTALFLDVPPGTQSVTVTVTGPGQVSIGTLLVGRNVGLGITEANPTAGIIDFSRKETDEFGEVTIVPRAWVKRMAGKTLIRTDALDLVANRIAAVRAKPSLWIGDAGVGALTVYGLFKDFSIELGQNTSKVSLSIEGLSEATKPGVLAPAWPDVVDSDPVNQPKPQDGATVGAPPGTPVGGRPAEEVVGDVDELLVSAASFQVQIDDLVDVYGDTVSAAASANAAFQYKAAAELAKQQAESFEDAATQSAEVATAARDASVASAASAASYKADAEEAASAAEQSEANAITKAAEAGAFAGQAAISKTGADGSASQAASSAGVSAAARDAAQLAARSTLPDNFTDPSQWQDFGIWGGTSSVSGGLAHTTQGGSFNSVGRMPIVPGQTYRITTRYRLVNQGGGNSYLGVRVLDAAGAQIAVSWFVAAIAAPTLGTWSSPPPATDTANSLLAAYPNAAFIQVLGLYGYPNVSDAEVSQLRLENITSEKASTDGANASSINAAAAQASQTAAGLSATSASESANIAGVKAGNSESSSNAAAGSAASASAAAAAALANMRLSASVGARSITPNPTFADWSGSVPTGWQNWGAIPVSKSAGLFPNPNAVLCDAAGNGTCGIVQASNTSARPGQWIVELDVEVFSSLNGVGVLWRGYDASVANISSLDYPVWLQPDINGVVIGATPPAGIYRFAIPITLVPGTVLGNLYVVSDGYFNNIAKVVKFHRVVMRPAGQIDNLPAEVNAIAGALASADGRQSAYWQTGVAVNGSAATASISVRADTSNPAAAPLTADYSPRSGATLTSGVSFQNRKVTKTHPFDGWFNAGFVSAERYTSNAYVQFQVGASNTDLMVGLGTDPFPVQDGFASLVYALYFYGTSVQVRVNGNPIGVDVRASPNDYFSVEVNDNAGGTVIFKKNGEQFSGFGGNGAGATFKAAAVIYTPGASVNNLVFGPAGPNSTASVAIVAPEIALVNNVNGVAKVGLRVVNGDAQFDGNIIAGRKIIMGNGSTGWEVARQPKKFVVTDGASVTWDSPGYIPGYTISTLGLAPLGSGETYNLYLDNLSATGGTARLKINVPSAPVNYQIGPSSTFGGTGAPQTVISKGGNPDAINGAYVLSYAFTVYGDAFYEGPQYTAYMNCTVLFYAKVGGVWVQVDRYDFSSVEYFPSGGLQNRAMTDERVLTCPAGVTDFGFSVSPRSNTGTAPGAEPGAINRISWSSPGSGSSSRTATPAGQTTQLTVSP